MAKFRLLSVLFGLVFAAAGCQLPTAVRKPMVRNPFPQLSKVAVAPFINLSTEPSVDGRRFALAYFNELQLVPGFEVVPIGVVENAMRTYRIDLANSGEARRLAQILGVDAVVVGAVTDYSPYYPPRLGLRVEWYAANPYYHPIPPGYGLPLDTPEEEDLPESLVYEANLARAKYQLESMEPKPPLVLHPVPPATDQPIPPPQEITDPEPPAGDSQSPVRDIAYQPPSVSPQGERTTGPPQPTHAAPQNAFVAPSLQALSAPVETPTNEPVLRHTRIYNGHDEWFTEALRTYHLFRDDRRDVGWRTYLQRSEDFIRFCCHLHIAEMLTARGGAASSELVFRPAPNR